MREWFDFEKLWHKKLQLAYKPVARIFMKMDKIFRY